MSITFSWFPREDAKPQERALRQVRSFAELALVIGPPKPYPGKFGIPMFSPAEWPPGVRKTQEGVLRIHFGVLDYDDVPEDDLVQMLARIDTPYVFVSSWSHGAPPKEKKEATARPPRDPRDPLASFRAAFRPPAGGKLIRGRLLLPFSRPVDPAEWPRVWRVLVQRYSFQRATPDLSCKDSSRCYFVPAHPQNPPAPPLYVNMAGPMEPYQYVAPPAPPLLAQPPWQITA